MRLEALSKSVQVATLAAPKLKQLETASKGVEAMFVKSLLGEMQKGTKLFGDGPGSDIYADLFNDAIAKQVADRGAFGIAELMVKQGTPRILAEAAKASATGREVEPNTSGFKSQVSGLRFKGDEGLADLLEHPNASDFKSQVSGFKSQVSGLRFKGLRFKEAEVS